jgi:hypothetical protein
MERIINLKNSQTLIKTYVTDLIILLFIYLTPALSHFFAFPIYYLDPMRIALVFGLILTSKRNSFILALTLPIFSLLISNHPQLFKSFLISSELLLNLALFYWFVKKIPNVFITFLSSILISKSYYYIAKSAFIKFELIDNSLFSTPFYYQIIIALILSGVLVWKFKNEVN